MGLNCTAELLANLHAACDSMPSKLKPYYRNTQFKLTLNVLPTEVRMLWRVEPDKEARDALPRPRCYLCDAGEDSITHMFGGRWWHVRSRFSRTTSRSTFRQRQRELRTRSPRPSSFGPGLAPSGRRPWLFSIAQYGSNAVTFLPSR